MVLHLVAADLAAAPVQGPDLALAAQAQAREFPVRGPVVLGSSMRVFHRLALVLWRRLMFDDGAVLDPEPAGACNAHSRCAAAVGLFCAVTGRLAGAKTPTDVRNRHVRAMNLLRRLETC